MVDRKVAIVNSRLHGIFVSSNNWLLNCLGFLDRFSMRSLNMVDRKVGGSNSESKGVSNVVHSLHQSIGIHILVSSSNNSISSFDLLFDRFSIGVSKGVLANVILRMVLGAIFGHSLDYRDNSL